MRESSWRAATVAAGVVWLLVACSAGSPVADVTVTQDVTAPPATATAPPTTATAPPVTSPTSSASSPAPSSPSTSDSAVPSSPPTSSTAPDPAPTTFTVAIAGDVNFDENSLARLDDPATAFGEAAPALRAADLTILNLETAITEAGDRQPKQFTFRAPPTAFDALEAAGVDVVAMANNHAADYGSSGLADTFAAMENTPVRVVGIGPDAAAAYAPYRTSVGGVRVAVFAATAYRDLTFREFAAGEGKPGVATAFSPELVDGVRAAAEAGDTVIVYLHWGTEYESCPDADQLQLAGDLAAAGAAAVVGTHAHGLQGAGWRADGTYIAYGMGNFLWWRVFGTTQDETGVLTLTFDQDQVIDADFAPALIDDRGVPVPVTGEALDDRLSRWDALRTSCTDLADAAPLSNG